jgi:hypothetical protein
VGIANIASGLRPTQSYEHKTLSGAGGKGCLTELVRSLARGEAVSPSFVVVRFLRTKVEHLSEPAVSGPLIEGMAAGRGRSCARRVQFRQFTAIRCASSSLRPWNVERDNYAPRARAHVAAR